MPAPVVHGAEHGLSNGQPGDRLTMGIPYDHAAMPVRVDDVVGVHSGVLIPGWRQSAPWTIHRSLLPPASGLDSVYQVVYRPLGGGLVRSADCDGLMPASSVIVHDAWV